MLYILKLASYIAPAANASSRRKRIDSWTTPDATSCQSPATSSKRNLPMEPDMDHLHGSSCITKHTNCWRKLANTKVVTGTFGTDGTKMTNTASLCQTLLGMRKVWFNTTKTLWKTIATLQQNKKEVGTRKHRNFHWMQKVFKDHWLSAVTLKRWCRHANDCTMKIHNWEWKQTYPSRATSPTKAQSAVCKPWRTSTWCFFKIAILSFCHNVFVFIFVITMATMQRLVVNVELGVMGIFILESTMIFSLNTVLINDFFISLGGNLVSWQSTGGVNKQHTVRAHVFLMRILSACLSQALYSHIVTHWQNALAWLKNHGTHF